MGAGKLLIASVHKDEKASFKWTDVIPDVRFIGLVTFMGMVRISYVQNYWSKSIY